MLLAFRLASAKGSCSLGCAVIVCDVSVPFADARSCATKCHGHHELVDVGCKMFVCDCASTRGKVAGATCPPACELATNAQEPCALNKYNHNFEAKFCVCKGPYEENADTMYQCVGCEDWYHAEHIRGMPKSAAFTEHFDDFVCAPCTLRMPFLYGLLGFSDGARWPDEPRLV